jgi:hypothetical protein
LLRRFLSPIEAGIAGGMLALSLVLFLIYASSPLASPVSTFRSGVGSASRGNLDDFHHAVTEAYYQNFVGHFGEARFHDVRAAYDEAYALARPAWQEYRNKAEAISRSSYSDLHNKVERLGKEAINQLPLDQRMQLTGDRQKYEDAIFEEGIKALTVQERAQIGDPSAFRKYASFKSFTDRHAWDLLSDSDRATLQSPAALASGITPEKTAFFERVGLPLLKPERRQIIEKIPSSELNDPQNFMVRYGTDPAKQFLANAAISSQLISENCSIIEEDRRGSLMQGVVANCQAGIIVRSTEYEIAAELYKAGGEWKVAGFGLVGSGRDLYEIPSAYPPPPPRPAKNYRESSASAPARSAVASDDQNERLQLPVVPNARWQHIFESVPAVKENRLLTMLSPATVATALFLIAFVTLVAVKTLNYRGKLGEKEEPADLAGETPIKTISIHNHFSKSLTRLTDQKVIQSRIWWWLSRRSAASIPWGDVQAIFWQRWMNLPLLLVAIALIGRINPLALLAFMFAVETKIYSIVIRRAFFHLPNSGIAVRTSGRKQFSELWSFFQLAHVYWQAKRTGKEIVTETAKYSEVAADRDFQFGGLVWAAVLAAISVAIVQRFAGHITFYDAVLGPTLLALPMVAGRRGLRVGLLSAIFGFTAILCVKFPDFSLIPGWTFGGDGGRPNPGQYLMVLVAFCVIATATALLSRLSAQFAPFALLLWLPFAGFSRVADLSDISTYARVTLAIAIGFLLSGACSVFLERPPGPKAAMAQKGAAAATGMA